jgi:hypothetical protein|tara:strand:- start:62 stop:376 length:315 start_codon:yes stop_codon:yes gene_type:complete
MANKLEKSQKDLINHLDEGLFSPILKKLVSGRLKRTLRKLEKDPNMRDAIKRVDKAITDFERELELGAELTSKTHKDYNTSGMKRFRKDREDLYKGLGLGHLLK